MNDEEEDIDDVPSARQIARGETRDLGTRSAKLAHTIMEMSAPAVKRMNLEEDLRHAIDRARKVTSQIARRRAERALAGDIRRFDLDMLAKQVDTITNNRVDVAALHLAEHWRTRLIEDTEKALAEFPGGDDELPRLVDAAKRERDTGRPPGAARALFRHVVKLLG